MKEIGVAKSISGDKFATRYQCDVRFDLIFSFSFSFPVIF